VLLNVRATPWPAGTAIRLLHVIDLAPFPPGLLVIEDAKQAANEAIGVAARKLGASGIAVDTEILVGTPRAAIRNYAENWGADLIIVGSRGHGSLARLLLGSVAQAIVRSARCAVQVVRPEPSTSVRAGMTILLATDGSECSATAIRWIVNHLPRPAGSIFRVASVIPAVFPVVDASSTYLRPDQLADEVKILEEQGRVRASEAIVRARLILNELGVREVEVAETLCDDPRAAIVDEAKRSNSNLVVLGSHGWHGLDRLLLGSVSEYVAVHASCSVMVVPPPK
jgi:nucleotide-binding universal stress UspA family protein